MPKGSFLKKGVYSPPRTSHSEHWIFGLPSDIIIFVFLNPLFFTFWTSLVFIFLRPGELARGAVLVLAAVILALTSYRFNLDLDPKTKEARETRAFSGVWAVVSTISFLGWIYLTSLLFSF